MIAERCVVETDLEKSGLYAVIEAIPLPLLVYGADGVPIASNSAARQVCVPSELLELLGSGPKVGATPLSIRLTDARNRPIPTHRLPIVRSLAGEVCKNAIVHVRFLASGVQTALRIDSSPLLDADGNITGAVAAIFDVTPEMRARRLIEENYEREHAIAVKLQESFLASDLPSIDGFECEQAYRPATNASMVGGDFCDVFRLSRDEYAVVIADVAGKGLNSAVYTAMTKYILRAYALEQSDPCTVLARLNDALVACTPHEVFVTLAYGVLDTRKRAFTYSNAGHEHPLLRRARGSEVQMLNVTGRALALMEGSAYTSQSVELAPGDLIVLYTDGITEAGSGVDRFGQDRLVEVIGSHSDGALADLLSAILREAQRFAVGMLADDVALLAIRCL